MLEHADGESPGKHSPTAHHGTPRTTSPVPAVGMGTIPHVSGGYTHPTYYVSRFPRAPASDLLQPDPSIEPPHLHQPANRFQLSCSVHYALQQGLPRGHRLPGPLRSFPGTRRPLLLTADHRHFPRLHPNLDDQYNLPSVRVVAPAQELGMRLRVLWRKAERRRQSCARLIKISHCPFPPYRFRIFIHRITSPTVAKPANGSAAGRSEACGGIRELERVKRGRRNAVAR
jgi:hypothetical protein